MNFWTFADRNEHVVLMLGLVMMAALVGSVAAVADATKSKAPCVCAEAGK